MPSKRRADSVSRAGRTPTRPAGSGGFLDQLGLSETGTGLSHGPMWIVLAFVAAVVIYPITRLIRALRR